MHGSYAANMGMTHCDLLIALGVRFDDRVTGRLIAFAPHAKVIHVDIDPAEIGKNRAADIPIVGDVKRVLGKLKEPCRVEARDGARHRRAAGPGGSRSDMEGASIRWRPPSPRAEIKPQHLMAEIDRLSGGEAIVATDVGQHQMWAAQFIRFNEPRPVAHLRRPRFHGIRTACCDRRAVRRPGQAGLRHRGRRRLPDVAARAGHGREPGRCPSRSSS